ncbi:MAG TPA: uracil-DNA glycosylase [Candidatus Acidoferrales bacterium]|nr:uracil-DNA glycosylase [Candidatus Acidoferrales bacterium]
MSQLNDAEELGALVTSLRRHLQRQRRVGIRFFSRGDSAKETMAVASDTNLLSGAEGDLFSDSSATYQAKNLEELRAAIGDCRRCKLWSGRTHLVFGVGNPRAKLMFVGEGPGRDEDLQGEPFVGRAGQLLTDIITKGMGLKREDVYICNVVKCRPPENRNPEPDEVASCEPFLKKQVDLVKPEIIVGLGKFAVQTLLQSKVPITRIRGTWHSYHGIKLMPTLHPAYLLRNPADKKLVWEDIKQVMKEMNGENT